MKFRKISARLLVVILPVIILALIVVSVFGAINSKAIIDTKTNETMSASLNAAIAEVQSQLNIIQSTADTLATTVASDYKEASLDTYEKMLQRIVSDNDIALGSGLWFEPYVYDKNEKYVGPYVYKGDSGLITTYEYSNAEYDYLSKPYYTVSQGLDHPVITNPYFDPPSGNTLSTCSVAIYDDGNYIGCASVGISLETIVQIINDIKVGENGTGMLMTSAGTYLAGVDNEKIAQEMSILDDPNQSLAAAGQTILNNESGITSYIGDAGTMNVYYTTLPGTNWKLAIQIPVSELNAPVDRLIVMLSIVCIIAVVVSILLILLAVSTISREIKKVQLFAGFLADGDFSIDPMAVKTRDELGNMSNSLNEMYASNKNVIMKIAENSAEIGSSSKKLREASKILNEQFQDIHSYMSNVNEAMLSTSAATEEVNASTEEVLSNVNLLAGEATENTNMSVAIKKRAADIGTECKSSSESANRLSEQFEKNLQISIKNAEVVSNIREMADVISNIAEQINLLSLNASIEAARAGESGRGFAVVASEIGNLAGSTTEAVSKIQQTIEQVQLAFSSLTTDAQDMLNFVQNTVTPDYIKFVGIASQYGQDAASFEASSEKISEMSENIRSIMTEVTDAIQNVADATQDTTIITQNVLDSVNHVSGQVNEVNEMSQEQEEISSGLDAVVRKFKF
jgi:methyl-accepting chemotaxis protein